MEDARCGTTRTRGEGNESMRKGASSMWQSTWPRGAEWRKHGHWGDEGRFGRIAKKGMIKVRAMARNSTTCVQYGRHRPRTAGLGDKISKPTLSTKEGEEGCVFSCTKSCERSLPSQS